MKTNYLKEKSNKKIIGFLSVFFLTLMFVANIVNAQEMDPCEPDCFDTPFDSVYYFTYSLDAPYDCLVEVWYSTRIACGIYSDLQIVKIKTTGSDCGILYPVEQLFKRAYYALLEANPMNFPPPNPVYPQTDACSEQWRISQASCWATYEVILPGQAPVTYNVQCIGSDCCLQRMRICRHTSDWVHFYISISPIGDVYPAEGCSHAQSVPPAPPGTPCETVCNWFISEESPKIESLQGDLIFDTNPAKANKDLFIKGQTFPVSIRTKSNSEVVIKISDASGIVFREFEEKCNIGFNQFYFDLGNLESGYYVYTIIIDGVQLETNKIILEK